MELAEKLFGYNLEMFEQDQAQIVKEHQQSYEKLEVERATKLARRGKETQMQEPQTHGHDIPLSNTNEVSRKEDFPVLPEHAAEKPTSPPAWYETVRTNGHAWKTMMNSKDPTYRQGNILLSSLRNNIEFAEKEKASSGKLYKIFEDLRIQVHKAEFLKVNELILKKTHMLDKGLNYIFESRLDVPYPWDLKADAFQLYNRWSQKDFSVDLLRGIVAGAGKKDRRNADSIDPNWPHRVSAKYYGQGTLIIGQWWPTQLSTVRDGAHGSPQGGIFGEKDKGAYSIVLSSGNKYEDEDDGDELWYSGTDGKDYQPSENTLRMIETCDDIHNPVRVIRSYNLGKKSPYRPEGGFRYDGLYNVVKKQKMDAEKATYRFRLIRCKDQPPIRCENNASRRPTDIELDEYRKLKESGKILIAVG
ncbi:hypothetical protein EJ04DRAFT_510512 [Polyplosphaeria fusca]|uniref:YDG domain-containing protein n=1 Tax=Polyplosphaeria fusca TaxID=682080 RepID=A0A9P4R0X2_9PLEO|nr:hypothetical protein EJ04DRAFT_510512 [Polyplosphaeria fusca]